MQACIIECGGRWGWAAASTAQLEQSNSLVDAEETVLMNQRFTKLHHYLQG